MVLRVGVTTGIYYIARSEELANVVKKIGYALTRGTDVIELSADVPHEVTYTDGKDIRFIADKQGLTMLFHGSLTVPFEVPERSDWRDAQDHIYKSIRSSVNAGCKYVLFHASLHFWLELMTYTSSKLDITMCDHKGRFISEILYESEKLREWFLEHMWEFERPYPSMALDQDELQAAETKYRVESDEVSRREYERRMEERGRELAKRMNEANNEINMKMQMGTYTQADAEKLIRLKKEEEKLREVVRNEVSEHVGMMGAKLHRKYMSEAVRRKFMKKTPQERLWRVDNYGKLLDAYILMAHYLFFEKDPIFMAMVDVYKDLIVDEYKLDYNNRNWVWDSWNRAQQENDVKFKEFFYAAVAGKFLEGHLMDAFRWIDEVLIKKELANKPDVVEYAKNLIITIENPDAREPRYAGRYFLYHPKQIYAVVKAISRIHNTNRIRMTFDFEHMATNGLDALEEMREMAKKIPKMGEYVMSVHSNTPNPTHSHYPIELGDVILYECMYWLRKCGMGKQGWDVFLLFERGGGEDPFKQAVDALKLVAKFVELEVEVQNLPDEFYGLRMTAGDIQRQRQIMFDHRFEPLKDLMEVPEEEWGLLSSSATRKGRQKEFKKAEMR